MRLDKKMAIYLFIFGLISLYITVYTYSAHSIARYVIGYDGTFYWGSTPSGSFFPWPKKPGPFMALSEMHPIDLFIYVFLIKSFLLFGVTVLSWIVFFFGFLYILKFKRSS